ncbi:MAG: 3-hydroxyacyl-CoA dehydrogenase family protein [Novosphingobium sp.]|nr:3-hydroxyacyl-CoA dehydrogenase family protein [Novosphingobium sp.]
MIKTVGVVGSGALAAAIGRLHAAESLQDLAPADIVIEAIVEQLEPKQALFAQLEAVVANDAILASNTSSLPVAAIAARCTHRERICGLHFFNPVPLMKLVEVIAQPATADHVRDAAAEFSKAIGKVPVVVRDGPGFLVNLGGRAFSTEALQIVQEGVATVAQVDTILRDGAGFRMGPFELMDLTGIDVNYPATAFIHKGYNYDPRLQTTTLHESMANAGRYGRKTGQGFYTYVDGQMQVERQMPEAPAADGGLAVHLPEDAGEFGQLRELGMQVVESGADTIALIAPVGEDAATACVRLRLDPANTVAIDFSGIDRKLVTLMAPLGGTRTGEVAGWLRGRGFAVHAIKDSPGFVLQRMLAMIANLGCEMAQIGVGSPRDIDMAMQLALNYPAGPLELADRIGPRRVLATLQAMQDITGWDRYRLSLWLRRRAMLGVSIWQDD